MPDAEKLVWLSLDRLEKAHLLETRASHSTLGRRAFTRREVLKMAGISLALLPVVKSIVLPTPIEAQCSPNCIFGGFLGETPFTTCEEACRDALIDGEILCSVGETPVGNDILCECRTQHPDPNPDDCFGVPDINPTDGGSGWR